MKKGILLVILFISLLTIEVFSQSFYSAKRDRKFILSAGTGVTAYFGDLNNPKDRFDTKLNTIIGLQRFVNDRISVRAEVSWFQLQGSDKEAKYDATTTRNLSFVSNNMEANIEGVIYLFPKGQRYYQRKPYNIYAVAGVGVTFFDPRAEVPTTYDGAEAGKKVSLRKLQTEGVKYGRFTPVIPFGIGVKAKVGPFFNVALEGVYRLTFTDYLDDVSTVYVDNNELYASDPLAATMADRRTEIGLENWEAGHIRGNPGKKDAYFMYNIKIEYFLSPLGIFSGGNSYSRKPGRNKYNKSRGRSSYKRRR